MVKPAVLLAAALLAAFPAAALDEKTLPREIRAGLDKFRRECVKEGGKETTFKDVVRTIDLNGDGRPDYILDLQDSKCDAFESLYCGTGGCELAIYIAQPNGKLALVFGQRVRTWEILPGEGARSILFDLHGSYCGKGGPDECPKTVKITGRKFQFRQR
jgi:hypothetical protein